MKKLIAAIAIGGVSVWVIGLGALMIQAQNFAIESSPVLDQQIGILHNLPMARSLEDAALVEKTRLPFHQSVGELPALTLGARAALAMDLDSGQVLYEVQSTERHQLASITKLLTAAVILDQYTWGASRYIPMSKTAFDTYGGNSLLVDEEFTVEDLVHALLMVSSNDSATLLAETFGNGEEARFIQLMNTKAQQIGMNDSMFANPHGLDEVEDTHYSTARDIMTLTQYTYETYPVIWEILQKSEVNIVSRAGRSVRIGNTNELLHTIPGMMGGKTGLTYKAKETFAAVTNVSDRPIGIVVVGCEFGGGRFQDTTLIYNWIVNNFKTEYDSDHN